MVLSRGGTTLHRHVTRHQVFRARSRGQGLVEFALVLPIIMLLLLSILQFVFIYGAQVGITNAVRETARNASAIEVASVAAASTAANSYYGRLTTANATGALFRNVSSYSPAALVTSGSPRTRVCYYSFTDASTAPAIMAHVEAHYSHPLFIPLLSGILDGADGVNDGGLRVSAAEDIRVANLPLSSAGGIGGSGSPTCNT
jgi:uncharacterized protein (UPF0333 family)